MVGMKKQMTRAKTTMKMMGYLIVLLGFCAPKMLCADEIGQSTCGKPIRVQGEIKHFKNKNADAVSNATDPKMYLEEVYGANFKVLVDGLPEGKYIVEIYLTETYQRRAGARVFSIYAGQEVLAKNLDLFAKVGFNSEYVVRGELVHQHDNINGPLELRFEAKKDMAKFNAIKILADDGVPVACVKAHELQPSEDGLAPGIPVITDPVVYTEPSLPVEQRVADLVRRMTLAEKVGQMTNGAQEIPRLGVPAYDYWNECLHGVARAGTATVFPQAIGMAAMWDSPMMHSVADTISTEARAKNNKARAKNPNTARYFGLTFWTPNINIFRDPRWGRGQETYGEDPFLTGTLGVSFIKGLQGDDPQYYKALACAKHFAVHSGPEKSRHVFNAEPTKRDLYETYLPQFEMAVKEGKVGNIMSVYNSIYGVPGPASQFLLTDILRNRWGFDGHVVSDCGGVRDVYANHKYVKTGEEAAAISVLAGNDLNCGGTYRKLTKAVRQGYLTEADIDVALSRILTARFRLGLFDSPDECAYLKISTTDYDTPEHSQLALEAARETMVLLKNDGLLPLNKNTLKRIAVIGPNAADHNVLKANYHGDASDPVSILEGIQKEVGSSVTVDYAKGCPLAIRVEETFSVGTSEEAKEALQLAKNSDVVVFVGGLNARLEGEEMRRAPDMIGFDKGDRTHIELPAPQSDLLKALMKTGTPVVFVNLSGSAIAIPWEAEHLPAILQAWYPGQNGGTAVADVLFGNYNPAGRLPVTFYRSTDDLPDFSDYSMANRTYRYFKGKPLYAFGHGLSYTTFNYSDVQASSEELRADGNVTIKLKVKNTGSCAGEEVVQLYVRHLKSAVPQALQSLAGFQRIALEKGESKVVVFELPASALRYWDEKKDAYVVPSGLFEVRIGSASDDIRTQLELEVLK
jgi:beta-glucosidase